MKKIGISEKCLIKVLLNDENFRYQIHEIVNGFFCPKKVVFFMEGVERREEEYKKDFDLVIYVEIKKLENDYKFIIKMYDRTDTIFETVYNVSEIPVNIVCRNADVDKKSKYAIKTLLYSIFHKVTGKSLPWGSLTGIRPARLVNELLRDGVSRKGVYKELTERYFISPDKASLAIEVARNQNKILKNNNKNALSVYISIPFCPTRCIYCSFPSHPISQYEKMVDEYIDTLILEMEAGYECLKNTDYKIESVYVGGGTPTSIKAEQLDRILEAVTRLYIKNGVLELKEFSVEAGRPDSIDEEKLDVLNKWGVSRISINPQSLNKRTLEIIGREHSATDFFNAFGLARRKGFNNINVDVIAGLPGETLGMFMRTLSRVLKLEPENISVHTMCIKRASALNYYEDDYALAASGEIEGMISFAYEHITRSGLFPFYMYRQKNMLGNLENVSYTKPGCESYYNIHIMEEDQSIIAFGAGASSKYSSNNIIEKEITLKNVEEYIKRKEEVIDRKKKFVYNYLVQN